MSKQTKPEIKIYALHETVDLYGDTYEVTPHSLINHSGGNGNIFNTLGIKTQKAKLAFVRKAYGYKPLTDHNMPYYKENDFEAASRLIHAIQSVKVNFTIMPDKIDSEVVKVDANFVEVGCQKIPYAMVKSIIDTMHSHMSPTDKRHPEQIRKTLNLHRLEGKPYSPKTPLKLDATGFLGYKNAKKVGEEFLSGFTAPKKRAPRKTAKKAASKRGKAGVKKRK